MLEVFQTPATVLHVMAALLLVLIVLIQPGKSGGISAALGGAGAQQVFGGRGAGNFLTKGTWALATTFFLTSVFLAYIATSVGDTLDERGTANAAEAPADEAKAETEDTAVTAPLQPTLPAQPEVPAEPEPEPEPAAAEEAAGPTQAAAEEAPEAPADEAPANDTPAPAEAAE